MAQIRLFHRTRFPGHVPIYGPVACSREETEDSRSHRGIPAATTPGKRTQLPSNRLLGKRFATGTSIPASAFGLLVEAQRMGRTDLARGSLAKSRIRES